MEDLGEEATLEQWAEQTQAKEELQSCMRRFLGTAGRAASQTQTVQGSHQERPKGPGPCFGVGDRKGVGGLLCTRHITTV